MNEQPGTSKPATATSDSEARVKSEVFGKNKSHKLEGSKESMNKGKRKKKKRKIGNEEKSYGLLSLFRFATNLDKVLLSLGLLFSIIHGSMFPVLALVFGRMTDAFIGQAEREKNHTRDGSLSRQEDGTSLLSFISESTVGSSDDEFISYLSTYSFNYLYIGLVVLFAAFVQTLCWELSCERQVYQLRTMTFSQILRQDISWYDTRRQTNLSNVLSDDIERIREGIGCKFSMVTQYVATFIAGTLVGVAVNWRLTGVLLLVAPLLIGATAYLAKLTAGSAAREQLKYGAAGSVAEEVLTYVPTVAAFGREQDEINRYQEALESGRRLAMRKYLVLAWGLMLVFFMMYAQYGLAFYYGAVLIDQNYSSPGSVFTVFFSVLSGAFTLGHALPYVNSVATAVGSASTVFSVVDRKPAVDPQSDAGAKPPSVKGHIQFQDVHFSYPSRPNEKVLNGLSLEIRPGQTVAVVGTSGSGKSTTLQLLLRLYDASSGSITLDGRPVDQLNLQWLRERVSLVSQEPVLFDASIAENIRYGRPGVSQEQVEMAATVANAHGFIDSLPDGYGTLVGERGAQLSGGQKQRLAIARALVRDPAVLLLDEATSALDSEGETVVQEALQFAMMGRTSVVVAHRLSTTRGADIIFTLDKGRLVEWGNHDELMLKRGLYYNLATTQDIFAPDDLDTPDPSKTDLTPPKPRLRLATSVISLVETAEIFPDVVRKIGLWMLVKMNRPECVCLSLGVFGSALSGAVMPTFAYFYGEVFSTFTKHGEELMTSAMFWSCMFVVLGALAAVSIWLEVVAMTFAVEKLVMRLRLMAFRNILRQPIGWFDLPKHTSGRLVSRLARDAPLIKGAAGLRLGQLLGSLVTLVAALTVAFLFGWKLACVLLLIVPLMVGGAYHQTLMVRRTQMRDTRSMDNAGRVTMECVQNIRTVQALCMERLFVDLYTKHLLVPYKEAKRQAVVYSLIFALSQAVVYVMYAAAFRFGAYLIQVGDMTSTDVYRVFFALAFCAASVGTSSAYVQDYNKAKLAAQQMFTLIDRRSEIDSLSTRGVKPVIKGLVRFESVSFHYPMRPDVRVLREVSLTLRTGRTLAVVGQSGCGKSTLVALLERFYQPTGGRITIDGVDIQDMNLQHLRRHIGLVTQEPTLFNRTIRENIAYGLADDGVASSSSADAVMAKVIKASLTANCHSFITQLPQGYETRVGEGGSQLSGGQKQRVAIARALVRDPQILLLDEATSALDTENEQILQAALDTARKGRTCIVIAHRLSTIRSADVIAVLDQGKIREMGSHEELMKQRALYYKLVRAQQL